MELAKISNPIKKSAEDVTSSALLTGQVGLMDFDFEEIDAKSKSDKSEP